ncbi:GDP-mannose 4,6-dehydratase [Alphaproteobacteria bacterium]|jgi:UDP-glucose 4-epimerase|nr:GDP-mannose 4,6-dehydratase [Alphaproteobacteria bacterium]
MKLIITGGSGFIGTNLVLSLINDTKIKQIVIIDNLKTSSIKNVNLIKKLDNRKIIKFHKISISERSFLNKPIFKSNFDILIHLAAQSSGENSFYEPVYDIDTNINGTLNILNLAKQTKVSKLIFTSTMSVYGNVKSESKINENFKTNPSSIYGITKLTSERVIESLCQKNNIKFTILRLFNVYGSYQDLSNMKQGMLSIYLSYLINNQNLIVKGSLSRYRDFIYIEDLINVFKILIEKKLNNKTYNIGTGKKTTVRKLINLLIKYLEIEKKNIKIYLQASTPGDVKGFTSNSNLFKKDYDWKIINNIEEGIYKTIKFYKND